MKAVSDALGVSRSNLVRRTKGESRPRQAYRMAEDVDVLVEVRAIIERRPTYGYRRVTATLSAYTAHETVAFARSLGLMPCFTPVRSPESNGKAESFVKTFKRDYVYVHDRPDAMAVLSQLDNGFEDDNEAHPHKGLKMQSPREFIRAQRAAACSIC